MNTTEALKAVFENSLSPTPSALALLAAHARADARLWSDVVAAPFASSDSLASLNAHRSEWQRLAATLQPETSAVPSITWCRAVDGVSREVNGKPSALRAARSGAC
jgi:CelD/BcsL family acetyltransferase involved in cellulose biosynthesis